MKPNHVLIPIDFSDTSLRALKYGLHVANAFSAEITLTHVLVLPADEDAANEAEQRMAALIPESFKGKARPRTPMVSCTIEEELLRTVREESVDLVVLGTRGLHPFKRFLLGSTTDRMLRMLPVPVITVSKTDESGEDPRAAPSVDRIVYPTDFSEPAETAFHTALEFARRFKAELEVVHVVDDLVLPLTVSQYGSSIEEGMIRHAEESFEQIISGEDVGEVPVKSTILHGLPWQAILTHVARTDADLIVMGLHGQGFVERAVLGSTAQRLVRGSPVPVLGIPAGQPSVSGQRPASRGRNA